MSGLFDYSSFINKDLLALPQYQLVQLLCTFFTTLLHIIRFQMATNIPVNYIPLYLPNSQLPNGLLLLVYIGRLTDQDIIDLGVFADVDNDALHFGYRLIEWR